MTTFIDYTKTVYFFELLLIMTQKELQTRYKNTLLGFLWLVLNPLVQMIIIGTVFTFFIKQPIKDYYFFLFLGLLPWNFLFLSLTKTTPCIVYERNLIKKARFPKIVIPLSIALSNFFHFLVAILLFFIPLLILKTIKFPEILFVLPAISLLFLFTIGLSLITSTLNVRYRDINLFVQTLLLVWFYATPILYSLSLIPTHLVFLWSLNPLVIILQTLRFSLLDFPPPSLMVILINGLSIVAIFVIGLYIFQKESKNFDDWI